MRILYPFLFLFPLFSHCQSQESTGTRGNYECVTVSYQKIFSQNELIARFDDDIVERLAMANVADHNGAMDRNKNGYFHVRFQTGISPALNYAIDQMDKEALENGLRAIEYSFKHQLPAGDFKLNVPENLSHMAPPSEGDLASGTAFFLASLGSGLLALHESPWFQSLKKYKNRLDKLGPSISLALRSLLAQGHLLKETDAQAPNRLLFDAVAYYSLGKYLNDQQAVALGLEFAELALAQQHANGYFLEKGGWDSSYQAVALENGFTLLSILAPNENFKQILYQRLACGTDWLASRILSSGEISTEGNTRVFEGGEDFLDKEKVMAFKSAVISLLSLYYHTHEEKYKKLSDRVLLYYQ